MKALTAVLLLVSATAAYAGDIPRDDEDIPLITLGPKHDFKRLHVVCPPYHKMQIEQKTFDSAEVYVDCVDAESRVEIKNLDGGPEQNRNCKITEFMERSGGIYSNCKIHLRD